MWRLTALLVLMLALTGCNLFQPQFQNQPSDGPSDNPVSILTPASDDTLAVGTRFWLRARIDTPYRVTVLQVSIIDVAHPEEQAAWEFLNPSRSSSFLFNGTIALPADVVIAEDSDFRLRLTATHGEGGDPTYGTAIRIKLVEQP